MAGPVPHDPTLRAICADVLPPGTRLLAGVDGLRTRVTWPAMLRTTGLGELEGGEIVLVPTSRRGDALPRLAQLAAVGVAAVVVAGECDLPHDAPIPVLAVPASTDLRRLQVDLERYISRRRREVFALDADLHELLVEPALAGATLDVLVVAAARRARAVALLDRDGDVLVRPEGDELAADIIAAAHRAIRGAAGAVELPRGGGGYLFREVRTGSELRGIVGLGRNQVGVAPDDEYVLSALASAVAIVLSRETPQSLPSVEELPALADGCGTITVMAMEDANVAPTRLARAVTAEMRARDVRFWLGSDGSRLVTLMDASLPVLTPVVSSLAVRLATTTLRCGCSRSTEAAGAARAVAEAQAALERAPSGEVVRYADVQLEILLGDSAPWREYASALLAPLLTDRADDRDLLRTARAYLGAGRNVGQAADILHVHRNTLHYRLRRIEERLHLSFEDAEAVFALDLATRIGELRGWEFSAGGGTR